MPFMSCLFIHNKYVNPLKDYFVYLRGGRGEGG